RVQRRQMVRRVLFINQSAVNRAVAIAIALVGFAAPIGAQANPPIRELTAIESTSPERFGNIFGARELVGGHVLVNDGVRRQLIELDARLTRVRIVLDSVTLGGNGYGPTASPLINYLGDSTLFVDGAARVLLVIDPKGNVAHAMAGPTKQDLGYLAGGPSGVDDKGRLLYRVVILKEPFVGGRPPLGKVTKIEQGLPDSGAIVRLDLDTRKVDTIARIKQQSGSKGAVIFAADGKQSYSFTVNPLESMDEWTVMSNGSIALVRGHDYHVDFLQSDGKTSSSAKLPYDWRKLSETDKQHLVDSLRAASDKARDEAAQYGDDEVLRVTTEVLRSTSAGLGLLMGSAQPKPNKPPPAVKPPSVRAQTLEFVPLNEIADYYPPVHSGSLLPDADGNVWILPNTSMQAKAGELVYDVVNARGELAQRVRLPVGRSIAGFGKRGIVYMMSVDGLNGWKLERAKIGS
ncbi:MAG: hypothetical protein ABJB66_19815, partial [Gemmatimonadaceae bacterium]